MSAPATTAIEVEQTIDIIRRQMPMVYGMVTDKAKEIGNEAYAHVRAGLRGEPNRFYAFEAGWVVGTPFTDAEVTDALAGYMVRFGVNACALWPVAAKEAIDGAH